MKFERSIEVERSPDDVFRLLSDAERMPEWTPEWVGVERLTDGPTGLGSAYRCKPAKGRGAGWEFHWSEFEPGKRLAWEGDPNGPVQRNGRYVMTANGDGQTEVQVAIEPKLRTAVKPFAPLVAILLKRHAQRDVRRLRDWLSSATTAVTAVFMGLGDLADAATRAAAPLLGA
jgi:uncharacterized protein YndB with AHSA1/START domain